MNAQHYNIGTMAKTLARGRELSRASMGITKGGKLTESKGWQEMVEGIKDEGKQAFVSLMLENYRQMRSSLDETTTTLQVGNFDKWAFPILSVVSENLIAQDIVSVQPLEGPTGQVFYMNFTTGQNKGNVPRGSTVWDARTGRADRNSDSGDRIETEYLGVTATNSLAGLSLSYSPVMPGTVQITLDSSGSPVNLMDDANGSIINSSGVVFGAINYNTGAITDAGAGTFSDSLSVEASYNYNSETNQDSQELDFEIQSSPIVATERKLRGRWSQEAAYALDALYKVNAESMITTAITNSLSWDIDREIIEDIRRVASAGELSWSGTAPTNVSYTEHKLTFVDALTVGSGFISRATNRARANWAVAGQHATNIIETLPQFEPASDSAEIEGVEMIGKISRMKIYADPHFPVNEVLLGYKGNDMVRAGYIFAPWVLLFSTPLVTLDDFINRKGFASLYGKKVVNPKMYSRINLTNPQVSFGA